LSLACSRLKSLSRSLGEKRGEKESLKIEKAMEQRRTREVEGKKTKC